MTVEGDKAAMAHCGDLHGGSGLQRYSRTGTSAAEPDQFRQSGASFSAKQLCSSVLMAGMDPDQVLKEDLAAGQGMIHTRIKPNAGRVEASALFGLIRSEAIQNGERGCTWQIKGHPTPRLPKTNSLARRSLSPLAPPGP